MRGDGGGNGRAAGVRACVLVAVGLAACVRQARPDAPAPVGIERSVFPLLVADGTPGTRGRYRACSATFVAPHLLVTSTGAFPPARDGVQVLDLGGIVLLDGDHVLTVVDVAFAASVPELVLLRTRVAGVPVVLRPEPARDREPMLRLGHRFLRPPRRGFLPYAEWSVADAFAIVETPADAFGLDVRTELHPGLCGAPVIDRREQVAGIIRGGSGAVASIIPAASIAALVRGASR